MSNTAADLFDDASDDNSFSDSSQHAQSRRGGKRSDAERSDSGGLSEEDSDSEDARGSKRAGRRGGARRKRARHNTFLDIEATVDSDDEEEDSDDGALGDFIVDNEAELASAEQDALRHRSAARPPAFRSGSPGDDAAEAAALAAELRARHSGYARSTRGGRAAAAADGDWTPQRLLIPGISDPHLWMAKCVPGKERDVVFAAARRVFEWAGKLGGVHSVFSRDGLSGYVYVEAHSLADAQAALDGIAGAFAYRMTLVPIDDMVDVVRIRSQVAQLNPGAWVRVRRGNYAGDLAQVVAVIEASEAVEVRLLPRIDYAAAAGQGARGAKGARPAARLFSVADAQRADARGLTSRNNEISWRGDRFVGGYLHRDMRVAALQTAGVDPTLDEIARFAAGDAGADGDEQAAIAALASAAAAAAIGGPGQAALAASLLPGETVEVVDGDLAGVVGTVRSVDADGTVRVAPELGGLRRGALMGFPAAQLRKRFRTGDHVQVQAGRHRGATGMVLAVADAVVTVYTDVARDEIRVLAKDLRVSGDVSSATTTAAANERVGLDVHDLVHVDGGRMALVLTAARDSLTVLDDRGETQRLAPAAVRPARGGFERSGVDYHGQPLRRGDHVREVAGQGRAGSVVQVTRYATFVAPRDAADQAAVFVVRTRQLESLSARVAAALDPYATRTTRGANSNANANANGGRGGGRGGGRVGALRGGRDPLVGKTVVITKGQYKGYVGICKDAMPTAARVELHTNARVVTIDKDKLSVKTPAGDTVPALGYGAGPRPGAAPSAGPSARSGGSSSSGGGGGWAASPAASSSVGGGWAASPGAATTAGGGGWAASPSAATTMASGGWAASPAATTSVGGWAATPAAAHSSSSGGGGWDAGNSGSAGGSSGWDLGSSAAAAAATPAASGWDATGSSSSGGGGGWGMPGPATPGGQLPQTPGGPSSYSAGTPGASTDPVDDGFFGWAVARAVVVLASGERATVLDVSADRRHATLAMPRGGRVSVDRDSVHRLNPRPARAEKSNRVIVVRGPHRNALGVMVGRDGSDAFFQRDGRSDWEPVPLRNLAVYADH
ncbi:transcription elongation factor spt5 [Coemansia interrupta]|uniref:Transcription elongation factor SPT5 n=1 Tax=Coemansia interrupta TaxID=1126814 RepID=A0A9W8HHG9_9FUNG|nr:transcription elongation factor spt5 [Coemansia interrupta]